MNLGVDITGPRTQVAPVGSGTSCTSPPVAIRRTCVEVAVGMAVEASTQELERPFINTVVVGGAGVANNYFFPFAFLVAFDTALRVLTK